MPSSHKKKLDKLKNRLNSNDYVCDNDSIMPNEDINHNFQSDYQAGLSKLFHTIEAAPPWMRPLSLFQSGLQVYCKVREIKSNSKNVIPEDKLTEILYATARVMAGPTSEPTGNKDYRNEINFYHKLSNDIRKYSLGRIVAASMLCLVGTLVLAASGIITAVTLGWMIPVGVLGGMLGISMIAGGVSAGISVGSGVSCLISGGIFFHTMSKKNSLRETMERVENSAREIYSFSK